MVKGSRKRTYASLASAPRRINPQQIGMYIGMLARRFGGLPPGGSGTSTSRKPALKVATGPNSYKSAVFTSTKKRKKKRKAIKIARPLRKKIKSVAKSTFRQLDWDLMKSLDQNNFNYINCAVNKVGWKSLVIDGRSDHDNRLNYDTVIDTNPDLVANIVLNETTSYLGKKFKFVDTHDFQVKNNTNSSCEFIVYVVKCIDYTSVSPLTDLTELRKASFSDVAVLAKEDDFNQYWTLPRVNRGQRKWQIFKHYRMEMGAGQESKFRAQVPVWRYDPSVVVELGSGTYVKGQYAIICRIMGKPAHGGGNSGDEFLIGMSPSQIDMRITTKRKTYMVSCPIVKPLVQLANNNLTLATLPVVGDPQQAGLGAYTTK